ncbi:MAG: ankyrin repeat domain-containing protein [Chloroflexota bacterium]
MIRLITRLRQLFTNLAKKSDPAAEPSLAPEKPTANFHNIMEVVVADDFEAIESARDWVVASDIPLLIEQYWNNDAWHVKRGLVEVLQDQYHTDMPKMMLDYLRAPDVRNDATELSKAIALGFIDEQYDQFMTYYNERALLHRDIATVLAQHGLQLEGGPTAPAQTEASSPKSERGAPPDSRLLAACEHGAVADAEEALADGADINFMVSEGNYDGCTPLMLALMFSSERVAMLLIDRGADIHFTRVDKHRPDDPKGQTALWWAANNGLVACATHLLDLGAAIDAPDWHGSTPLTTAASSGHLEIVELLVTRGANIHAKIYDGRKAFNLAVTNGHTDVATHLLKAGNEPDERGSSGYTPLMIAAESNFYDMAKMLVELGADVNAVHSGPGIYRAMKGWIPLVFAVRSGYVRMTKLLLEAGADVTYRVPSATDKDGNPTAERGILAFNTGKRAESIEQVLRAAGAAS